MFSKDCQRSRIRDLVRNQRSCQKSAISPEVPSPHLPDIQQRLSLIQNQRCCKKSAISPEISHLTRSAITWLARRSAKTARHPKSDILLEVRYLAINQPSRQKCHHLVCLMISKDCQSKIRAFTRNQQSRQKSAISPEVRLPSLSDVQQRLQAIKSQRSCQESAISSEIRHLTISAITWLARLSARTASEQKSEILPGISNLARNQPSHQKCHHLYCRMFSKDCQQSKTKDLAGNQPSRQISAISPERPSPGLLDVQQRLPAIQKSENSLGISNLARNQPSHQNCHHLA